MYHMEKTITVAHLEGNPCPLAEMFICHQEVMDTLLKTAIQAEITQVPVITEIMHPYQETILTVIMVIPVHGDDCPSEAVVIGMAVVVIRTVDIIQVEVPIEILVRAMVTHVVLHLHEAPPAILWWKQLL